MGVTRSNCGLFSTPGFVVQFLEKEKGWGSKEGGKKGIEKERLEGGGNKERLEAR